ncbi:DUF4747 family protein [Rudanella paleaurantiibacter]|nr:DUF4747 family protein [Rudanella paleaurantiibacter]
MILNIKLISDTRKGEEAYKEIMRDIYEGKIIEDIGRGKRAFLRTMNPESIGSEEFYYGKITRFSNLENNKWVNINTREIADMDIENGLYPNRQETDYVFIPQAHRFAVKLSPEFTVKNAQDFFTKAIKNVLRPGEDFAVIIQQSKDVYDEIYRAKSVEKLFISVSYTNSDDIGDAAAEWLDQQLKESNIMVADFSFESEKHDTINLQTTLIKGGLDLAVENGEVEAKIRDERGRAKKIITKNHPERIKSVAPNEDQLKNVIFMEVKQRYRSNDE